MTSTSMQPPTKLMSALMLAGFILLCLAVGGIGSVLTTPSLDPWYASLVKPAFNPPNWIFAPVWTTLFVLMAVAVWRIWKIPTSSDELRKQKRAAYLAFGVQLVLNVDWSAAFFYLQSPGLGLMVIVVFAGAVAWTMRSFAKLDRLAGLMFVPYLAWVCFAIVLNLSIFLLN